MSSLYISDLDGTLLRNDATLSAFSEAALHELLAEGLPFTVASARSVVSMQTMLRGLPVRLPVIEFNGAFLSDLTTGRHEVINALEPSVTESVYRHIAARSLSPFVSSFNGAEDRVHYSRIANDGMQWYLSDRLKHKDRRWREAADDLRLALREQVVCLTVIAEEPALAELQDVILQEHGGTVETHVFENRYSPGWHWLTIHDCKATKDQAVRTLVERHGLGESQIVAFGDQINDVKMLQRADCAVAVGNAVDELKRHADLIIGPNENDSVVKFIRERWKKEQHG